MGDTVGDRIRAAAGARNLSISALSERTGVPLRTLHRYLAGESDPGAGPLARICDELGVNGEWLLLGRGLMQTPEPSEEARAFRVVAAVVNETRVPGRPIASMARSTKPGGSAFTEDDHPGDSRIVRQLRALLEAYCGEQDAIARAFSVTEAFATKERAAGRLSDAEWRVWLAVREGAVLARAYRPEGVGTSV